MGRIVIICTVLACALFYGAFVEYRMSSAAKSAPQRITCEQLARDGYGDNAWITLTDFAPSSRSYVYEETSGSGRWNTVWMPLVSRTAPDASTFNVILSTSEFHSEGELQALRDISELTGMVVNQVSSLGSKQKDLLANSYPGVNFDKVWIFQQNRKPHGMGFVLAMAGGGILLLIPGTMALIKRRG